MSTVNVSILFLILPCLTTLKLSAGSLPSKARSEHVSLIRQIREVTSLGDPSGFSWKATKTPQFVTSKMKKEKAEPILTVFPSYAADLGRNSRSRELIMPTDRTSAKRIVYYATLPDITHYQTHPPTQHYTDFVSLPVPVSNQQRSYDPSKAGKDFVTRVQSSIIELRPSADSKGKDHNSTPSFTIIDAPPTNQYPPTAMDRIMMYPEYPKPSPHYHLPYSYPIPANGGYKPYIHNFRLPYSNSYYYNSATQPYSIPQVSQLQYKQQSPYYGELEKTQLGLLQPPPAVANVDPYQPPPYPSRHTRFPTDRYPMSSPLSDLEPSKPSRPARPAILDSDFHQNPSVGLGNLNINGVASVPNSGPGPDDFNDDVGPSTFDNSLDLDNRHFSKPLSFRNKFLSSNNNNLGNKYLGLHSLNDNLPIKMPESPLFNSQYSQVSDWLTSKPSEFSSFDLDDFNAAAAAANAAATSGDYYNKGGSLVSVENNNQNGTPNSISEGNNTIITPFTNSLSNNTEEERSQE